MYLITHLRSIEPPYFNGSIIQQTSQTPVVMTSILMHFNPDLLPSPHTFSPDRWLQPDSAHLRKYIVAFSKGSRQWLGMKYVHIPYSYTRPHPATAFAPIPSLFKKALADVDGFFLLVWHTANSTLYSLCFSHLGASTFSFSKRVSVMWRSRMISLLRVKCAVKGY